MQKWIEKINSKYKPELIDLVINSWNCISLETVWNDGVDVEFEEQLNNFAQEW